MITIYSASSVEPFHCLVVVLLQLCVCVSCMPDRINEPPTLQAERALSMRPCFASNTFIIQHTVTAPLISLPLSFPLQSSLISPSFTCMSFYPSSPSSSCLLSFQQPYLSPRALFLISSFLSLFHSPRQSFPYLNLSLIFSRSSLSIILFPEARDDISSPYASVPTCNMLAHDKIVSPSASCREWEEASINTVHQPTVTGSHPPHDNDNGYYSPSSFLHDFLYFFLGCILHPSFVTYNCNNQIYISYLLIQSNVQGLYVYCSLVFSFPMQSNSHSISLVVLFSGPGFHFPSLFLSFSYCFILNIFCVIEFLIPTVLLCW